jgi:hypothetical protein
MFSIVFSVSTNNHNISPQEMIDWFRSQAAEFTRIANTLEDTFNSRGVRPKIQAVVEPAQITLDQIRQTLGSNSMRPADIATSLKTSKELVSGIVDKHPETFEKFGKGWIKAK